MAGKPRKELDEKQLTAIEMIVEGETNVQIAKELGVDQCTIHRWKKNPLFEAALNERYEIAKTNIDKKIYSFANDLIKNIYELARKSKSEKVRLDASVYLLNRIAGTPVSKVESKQVNQEEIKKEPTWDDLKRSELEGNIIEIKQSDIS